MKKEATAENGVDEQMLSEEVPAGDLGNDSEPVQYSCDTCGVDCTASRYHSIRRLKADSEEAFDVCPACYSEGRFPSNLFSGDFLRLDSATNYRISQPDGQGWSDQETLLLLEGLEIFNDDWDRISEHVGSRTREECVAHFLQLPIEDEFLVNEGGAGPGAEHSIASTMGRVQRLPFSQPDHPVLSVIAFLASVVDPEVAATAASESVKELTEALQNKARAKQENGDAALIASGEGGMSVDGQHSGKDNSSKPSSAIHRSANLALASAASKAHLLAQQTSTELTAQIHALVSLQVTKLSLKLSQFESLEASLDNERRQVEMAKQLLQMERLGIEKQLDAIEEVSRKVGEGEVLPQAEVERLRGMSTSDGSYRSGMPPKTTQVQSAVRPLNGQAGNFIQID